GKAALILLLIWGIVIGLHFVSWGIWLIWVFTGLVGLHALRTIMLPPPRRQLIPLSVDGPLPYVSFLIPAKNEEAAITPLIEMLDQIDYPGDRYEIWAIDDNSSDGTPELLDHLSQKYDRLNVLHRDHSARGGKSGALNQAVKLAKGDIIAIFDADAQVSADFLWRVLPLFQRDRIGAVQVRKAISNAAENLWTQGQRAEMILDAYLQEQRVAVGGIGELRGNGQVIRRTALERCGYFNEETITDDLDLTLRLHLDRWDIDCVTTPTVREEGVTEALALWHQRSRWAEGGYQRYLDYWRLLCGRRLSFSKRLDLLVFLWIQYLLPTAAFPDLLLSLLRTRLPLFSPMTTLTISLSLVWMFLGLRRVNRQTHQQQPWPLLLRDTVQGTLYMLHWLLVMASTTARLAVRPKRLKWVKTVHRGVSEAN
ncbi:MAG: glycosyltransferase, partial [Phormidium sp.]